MEPYFITQAQCYTARWSRWREKTDHWVWLRFTVSSMPEWPQLVATINKQQTMKWTHCLHGQKKFTCMKTENCDGEKGSKCRMHINIWWVFLWLSFPEVLTRKWHNWDPAGRGNGAANRGSRMHEWCFQGTCRLFWAFPLFIYRGNCILWFDIIICKGLMKCKKIGIWEHFLSFSDMSLHCETHDA